MRWLKRLLGEPEQELGKLIDERLAAAALLYEVARADGSFDPEETGSMVAKLVSRWALPEQFASDLLDQAGTIAESVVDLHPLVHSLRKHWGQPERIRLVHDMWAVAHADGQVHPLEEHVIRRVADLLHVPHSEFIRGKLQ